MGFIGLARGPETIQSTSGATPGDVGTNALGTNALGTNALGTNALGDVETNALGTNALGDVETNAEDKGDKKSVSSAQWWKEALSSIFRTRHENRQKRQDE